MIDGEELKKRIKRVNEALEGTAAERILVLKLASMTIEGYMVYKSTKEM